MFICMDKSSVRNAVRILNGDPDKKVRMLLEREISDPWYTNDFETTYFEIFNGCKKLLESIL